jgi:hypothetical protein
MQKISFLIAILLLTIAGTHAQQTPAEKYVQAFSEKKNKWLIEPNTDSLKGMLDSRCLYIHSNGWVQKADEVVNDLQSKKLVYEKIVISESQARQFESMVVVTGKGHVEGKVNGNPFNMNLVFTEVYVKRKASWKLVSRHSNKME